MSRHADLLPPVPTRAPDAAPSAARDVLAQPGRALDHGERAHYERTLTGVGGGQVEAAAQDAARRSNDAAVSPLPGPRPDFSRVRVHSGGAAEVSAARIGARAYAFGEHVVLGAHAPAQGSSAGRRELAHELAHVAQQQRLGTPFLARDALTEYSTEPTTFKRADIESAAGIGNYWDQKVQNSYATTFVNDVEKRLKADAEEMSAVMSAAWNARPAAAPTASVEKVVAIGKRAGVSASKPLLFRFTFGPSPQPGTQPTLKVELMGEEQNATVGAALQPPAGFTLPTLPLSGTNFPNGIRTYFSSFPDEQKQLYNWIQSAPGPAFNQIVTLSSSAGGTRHDAAIRAEGTKDQAGKVTRLEMTLITETPLPVTNPPPGYNDMTHVDLEVEKLQDPGNAADKRLGTIKGLDTLPADERTSVKYAVQQYFANGTRNAEVDLRLPIANSKKQVLYTLRFGGTSNDVDVERVGEEGKDAKATIDTFDVSRAAGFAQNSADAATLKSWLGKRYPSITVTATDVPGILAEANKAMAADAGTVAWFDRNYGIKVLDKVAANARLTGDHKFDAGLAADLKDFTTKELERMEFALEHLSDPLLALVRGAHLVRQKVLLKITGSGKGATIVPDDAAGITWRNGSHITIGIADKAAKADDSLFIGGSSGTRAISTMIDVHEFGHVVGDQQGIATAFNAFVKKKKLKPATKYAKSDPAKESFPEAFALFHADPQWLLSNQPDLHAWFTTLSATGKAPPP